VVAQHGAPARVAVTLLAVSSGPYAVSATQYEPNHRTPEPCRTGPDSDGKSTCLTHARTPAHEYIEEIPAEQEQKNAALRTRVLTNVPRLRIADRYAAGRKHA